MRAGAGVGCVGVVLGSTICATALLVDWDVAGRAVCGVCGWGGIGRVARMKRSNHDLALRSSLSASALIRFIASSESITEKVLLLVVIGYL